ncbi:MAG: type II toxin-antitoxin system VapC family toxin [Treponema sp.]|nr:type II toxin-antitoxin system VapC family toxin [Treponema sp.]
MYLLDTHTFLWYLDGDENLSPLVRTILSSDAELGISIGSFWEIAIKQNIGKLKVEHTPLELMNLATSQSIFIQQIEPQHLNIIRTLERIHNEPFDRLIIAQAMCEKYSILTCDTIIPKYNVTTIW